MPINPQTALFSQILAQRQRAPGFAALGQGIQTGTNNLVEGLRRIADQKRQDEQITASRDFTADQNRLQREAIGERDRLQREQAQERFDWQKKEAQRARIRQSGKDLMDMGKGVADWVTGLGEKSRQREIDKAKLEAEQMRAKTARMEALRREKQGKAKLDLESRRVKAREQQTQINSNAVKALTESRTAKQREVARARVEKLAMMYQGRVDKINQQLTQLAKGDDALGEALGSTVLSDRRTALERELQTAREQARLLTLALIEADVDKMNEALGGLGDIGKGR